MTKKNRKGSLLCFKKFPVSKTFMHRRGGGGHHGLVEKSFVSQDLNEKLGEGTLLFSRKYLVSKKNFRGRRGDYHDFAQ